VGPKTGLDVLQKYVMRLKSYYSNGTAVARGTKAATSTLCSEFYYYYYY